VDEGWVQIQLAIPSLGGYVPVNSLRWNRTSDMSNDRFPLNEVLGFPTDNHSEKAVRHREQKLCPFSDYTDECTKTNAGQVIGTCSNQHGGVKYIVCPKRMEEHGLIFEDAASTALDGEGEYTVLKEMKLDYENDGSAGNVDFVVAKLESGEIADFASLEVQSVYTSGNSSRPVNHFLENPEEREFFDWKAKVEEINRDDSQGNTSYVTPDWKSAHRKRLVPQILQKGRILNRWDVPQVIATQEALYEDLGKDFVEVEPADSDLIWLLYDLTLDDEENVYHLTRERVVHTTFNEFQSTFSQDEQPESRSDFEAKLRDSLDEARRFNLTFS